MNLVEHARAELQAAGLFDADSDYEGWLGTSVLQLIQLLSSQGHTGSSVVLTRELFEKLSQFLPLTPLQGTPDEWEEVGEDYFQNKRCSRILKHGDQAFDVEAVIFREPGGSMFIGPDSCKDITFPYTPTTTIVDVPSL